MLWRVMAAWPGTVAGGVRSLGPATRFLGLFVLVVYGLSWVADTQTLLGVSPGLLGPPAFFLWPLVTHVFVEIGLGGLVCSLTTVRMTSPVAVSRFLEPVWGPSQLLLFFLAMSVTSGLMAALSALLAYAATSRDVLLFGAHFHGIAPLTGAFCAALAPGILLDSPLMSRPRIWLAIAVLTFFITWFGLFPLRCALGLVFGGLSGWGYLKVRPQKAIAAPRVPGAADVMVTFRRGLMRLGLLGGGGRRQLALKALDERLRKAGTATAWPSLESEVGEAETAITTATAESNQ
uniref:Uncharacterized protein n=1 Tax=Eptatretus burgeri TaxID=7764 RepID=A0A8C4WZN2_EPTBU